MELAATPTPRSNRSKMGQLILLWASGSIGGYFMTCFLSIFYRNPYHFHIISFLSVLISSVVMTPLLANAIINFNWHRHWAGVFVLMLAYGLTLSTLVIVLQFPGLFDRRILFMNPELFRGFLLTDILVMTGLTTIVHFQPKSSFMEKFKGNRVGSLLNRNLPGIFLGIAFFAVYFMLAETINFPGFRTLDQFFDSDISLWLERLESVSPKDVPVVRAVHPALLVFLRPLVWFISLVLHGNRLHAVFLGTSLAGSACVMLTWALVKKSSGSTSFALIIATLLGASASHLLLGSMIETYIYSSLALIGFSFLMQDESKSLKFTLPVGILVAGITITNLIQTCILYLTNSLDIRALLKYVLAALAVTILLNQLQVSIYPNSLSMVRPSHLATEGSYRFRSQADSWRVMGRIQLIGRAVLLYGIVAPRPFILMEELGSNVPNFRTFQITVGEFHVAGYSGISDFTVKIWAGILAISLYLFVSQIFSSPLKIRRHAGFLLCLAFNFILHVAYGDDPMLYSPDWVYALVLFVAFSLQQWAENKWLQVPLIIFLGLMMASNLKLIHQIMTVSAPFYGP